MNTVSEMENPSIAQQIADIERDVNEIAFAYASGFLHGQQKSFEAQGTRIRKALLAAKEAAEAYESLAKQRFEEFKGFSQLRIGVSPELGDMSVMAILAEEQVELLADLQDLSRELEIHYLESKSVALGFLTMACNAPDKFMHLQRQDL